METLALRKTHKFVGTYRDEDQWEPIGALDEIDRRSRNLDSDDACDPIATLVVVKVEPDMGVTDEAITNALYDHYTAWGCAHEYDCCGCRSYRATGVRRLAGGPYWAVAIHSSRNY